MLRRLFIITIILVITSTVFGCSTETQHVTKVANDKPTTLKLSHQVSASHSIHKTATRFAELLKEISKDTMVIELYPSAALGSEKENLEALSNGTLDISVIALEFYPEYIPEVGVSVLPYIYDDYNHAQRALLGGAGDRINRLVREGTDVEILGYFIMPARQIGTNDYELRDVTDLKGLKIRVPESPAYVEAFDQFGSDARPMPWDKVYGALESGEVQAVENTFETFYYDSVHEVVNRVYNTDHLIAPSTFSISGKVYDSLSAEQRGYIEEAMAIAIEEGIEAILDRNEEYRLKISEFVEVIELDKEGIKNSIDYYDFDVLKLDEALELKKLIDEARE